MFCLTLGSLRSLAVDCFRLGVGLPVRDPVGVFDAVGVLIPLGVGVRRPVAEPFRRVELTADLLGGRDVECGVEVVGLFGAEGGRVGSEKFQSNEC